MKFSAGIVLLLVCIQALQAPAPSRAQDLPWNYEGHNGPEHWGEKCEYRQCNLEVNKFQSPIDINTHHVDRKGHRRIYHIVKKARTYTFKPHAETNNYKFDCEKGGSELRIGYRKLKLRQVHFHAGSENMINGKQKDLEMHLVHSDDDGNRAVVSILFDAVPKGTRHRDLVDLSKPIEAIKKPGSEFHLNIRRVLKMHSGFYNFAGSLTTPPCSDNIEWVVQKHIMKVTQEQIDEFRKNANILHRGNWRPVQPHNGRTIRYYY